VTATAQPDPFAGGRKFERRSGSAPTEELVSTTMRGGRSVALTFDDGPDPRYTPQVLDLLAAEGVVATFCLIGSKARRRPDLVRRIAAAGHVLCNHTMTHVDLADKPMGEVQHEIAAASAAIAEAAPNAPLRFFRAPYGSWSTTVRVAAMDQGLQPLDWSVNPCDWARPGVQQIVDVIDRDLRPGGVILMHDSDAAVADGDSERGQTVAALSRLVPMLRDRGYTFDVPAFPADLDKPG
jgi:chitooligosaccharide deacetylase